jgi:hypothetical protein
MSASRVGYFSMVVATALLAMASFAGGILFLLGLGGSVDFGGRPIELGVGLTLLTASGALVTGIWRFSRTRRTGPALLTAGALPVAICFWWTGVVPAVALTVAIAGVVRSRRSNAGGGSDSHSLAAG